MNEQSEKYLKLARRAREEDNVEDAKKYYDMLRTDDPENAEAVFYYQYYRLWDSKKGEWLNSYTNLCNATPSVIKMVAEDDSTDAEKLTLLRDIYKDSKDLWKTCKNIQMELYKQERGVIVDGANYNVQFGVLVEELFGNKTGFIDLAVTAWKEAVQIYTDYRLMTQGKWNKEAIEEIVKKIQQHDPSYSKPEGKGTKGCITVSPSR